MSKYKKVWHWPASLLGGLVLLAQILPGQRDAKHALPTPVLAVRHSGLEDAPITRREVRDHVPLQATIENDTGQYQGVRWRWALYRDGALLDEQTGDSFDLDAHALIEGGAEGANYTLYLVGTKSVPSFVVMTREAIVARASVRLDVDLQDGAPSGIAVPRFTSVDAPAAALADTPQDPAREGAAASPTSSPSASAPSVGLVGTLGGE